MYKLIIVLSLICLNINALELTSKRVKEMIQNPTSINELKDITHSHPYFVIKKMILAIRADKSKSQEKVISEIEEMLQQRLYKATVNRNSGDWNPFLGESIGSMNLWREVAYILVGRAYYETKDYKKAKYFLNGISENSKYWSISSVESAWSSLKLDELVDANTIITKLEFNTFKLPRQYKTETVVLRSYYLVKLKKYQEALNKLNEIKLDKKDELYPVAVKVIAQSMFNIHIANANKSTFKDNRKRLKTLLSYIESLPVKARDDRFGFLASEAYWLLARLLRVEDPVKYQKEASAALIRANLWIKPYADVSIRKQKALITEEAMFFAGAILWEQGDFLGAIPRLDSIPHLFPQGEYREDVYQLLGDYYYDKNKFKTALGYYRKLAKSGSRQKAAYGVYKAAWTFYNMQAKWKSLRHLEQLLVFYKKELSSEKGVPPGSLAMEVEKDFLLVLAELMPYPKAKKELDFFKFVKSKRIEIEELLGVTYKKIGKFDDAIMVWSSMLNEYQQHDKTFAWMRDLIQDTLNGGKRELLSSMLKKHYMLIKKNDPKDKKIVEQYDKLYKSIIDVVLVVHKEGRKTDDPEIWKSVDALYSTFNEVYPDYKGGQFYYYGGQRYEKLGNTWKSSLWYKKASMDKKFENYKDAALSVLRLVKSKMDDLSIKEKKTDTDIADFGHVSEYALWYVNSFYEAKQRRLAEEIYMESLFESKKYRVGSNYIIDKSKHRNDKEEFPVFKNLFLTHNKRLYDIKEWDESNYLSNKLSVLDYKFDGVGDQSLKKELIVFEQETAFQVAFNIDSKKDEEKKKQNKDIARKWYKTSIIRSKKSDLALRAWHNLLIGYDTKTESSLFIKDLTKFKTNKNFLTVKKFDNKVMLKSIYMKEMNVWAELKHPVNKARALYNASKLTEERETSLNMKWKALTVLSSHYQIDEALLVLKDLEQSKFENLSNHLYKMTLTRLFLHNGKYRYVWNELKRLISTNKKLSSVWVLLRDIYYITKVNDRELNEEIRKFIVANQKEFREIPFLLSMWAKILYPNYDELIAEVSPSVERLPAAINEEGIKEPFERLKLRLGKVPVIFEETKKDKGVITKKLKEWLPPQIGVELLCLASGASRKTINSLEKLKSPEIVVDQWKDFVANIDSKINEYKQVETDEVNKCNSERLKLTFINQLDETKGVLCSELSCFDESPASSDKVISLVQSSAFSALSRLDQIYQLVRMGAWATAEFVAYSEDSTVKRSMLLALIRIARNDTWNAFALLKEAEKDEALKSHAKLFLSFIALKNKDEMSAKDAFTEINSKELSIWEQDIYNVLRNKFNVGEAKDISTS